MTSYTQSYDEKYDASQGRQRNWPMFAALGAGISLVLTAVGVFWDITGNDTSDQGASDYLFSVAVIVVATGLVFGLVARTADASNGTRRALVLAVLSLPSLMLFWAGLPVVVAAGAVSCATTAGLRGTGAKVAVGIAALTTVLAVVAAIAG
jgi:FtsH-binding integral membrane protein